jgi:hypothetical protein
MYFSSKSTISGALALALASWGFGSGELQAKGQQCPVQKACPAPVLQKPAACCPAPVLEKPSAPPAETCCPVDPKEVKKAQKEAEHAQHEAAEACERQQKAAQKAQERIDKAAAKGQADVDAANAKLQDRNSEWAEANAKLESLSGTTEAVAQTTPEAQCEPAITRAKPEPAPEPAVQPAPEPKVEEEVAVIQPETPAPIEEPKPVKLPKTASPLDLIGLIGLLSLTGGSVSRFFRR